MIGVLNYGVGNVASFLNCFNLLNISARAVSVESDFEGITKLILPGVGHFDVAVEKFRASPIFHRSMREILENEMDVLGICVGMQMLACCSEEGESQGLSLIDANVLRFDFPGEPESSMVLPHMGWNSISFHAGETLFKDINPENNRFYFLHSFYFSPTQSSSALAFTVYGNQFCSVVNSKNVYGCQFHPEKSHSDGLRLLKKFRDTLIC